MFATIFPAYISSGDTQYLRGCHHREGQSSSCFSYPLRRSDHRTSRLPVDRSCPHQHSASALCASHFPEANFLIYASDASGADAALPAGYQERPTAPPDRRRSLDPACFTLAADERTFCYIDGGALYSSSLTTLQPRQVYRPSDGYQPTGMSLSDDGMYAGIIEKKQSHYRLQWIRVADGVATTLAEADEELSDPSPRPRRASVLYRRAGGVWLANLDGKQNYRLKLAEGQAASAVWSPEGRTVLYLNVPVDPHKLRNIREFIPDSNEDKALADTTQYACFERNPDASVFVGASGSKASPHVLLLVRAVRREFTLCEHRASDPSAVSPIFSPNSQSVFFMSDQHRKVRYLSHRGRSSGGGDGR